MSFIFGDLQKENTLTPDGARDVLIKARAARDPLVRTPVSKIIEAFEEVGELWKPGQGFYERALEYLASELSFSEETLVFSLQMIPKMLSQKSLIERLKSDFGNLGVLDRFSARDNFEGQMRFVPHGILLHVAAGNVFLGAIDSLALGLLTKNVSIMKLASSNQLFPMLFAESVLAGDVEKIISSSFALLHWKGGDKSIESIFKKEVDAIVAWGGEEMVNSYRAGLAPGIVLLEHGPKLSFQVITARSLETHTLRETALNVSKDIIAWDQAACASPQNLFIEKGINSTLLVSEIALALESASIPRGKIDADEAVEILKEESRAKMTSVTGDGVLAKGRDWLLHFDPRPGIRPSPLNRTLIIKTFSDLPDLLKQLEPGRRVLQSCGYQTHGDERDSVLNLLAEFGVLRFARLGTVLEGMNGAPHDGRLSLLELGRLVPDESKGDVLEFATDVIHRVPFYKDLYNSRAPKSTSEFIPLSSFNLPISENFPEGGFLFSSGGTSGNSKYVFFTGEEFQKVADMLAIGFQTQGLKAGDICANLFVAGNLWSSFMAVDKALATCEAVQLPIGGMAEQDLILTYLEKFKPRAVFGLPSLLIDLAMKSKAQGRKIQVEKIFYAGEHLTEQGRQALREAWNIDGFHSAGYASVDAGPIGYQCQFSAPREHHLFKDFVHLEIIEGEGLVTSLVRKIMPVLHLKTGDHLEWVNEGPCQCGSLDPRFILHGRIDGQMRIWASRVLGEEIERAFQMSEISAPFFQVVLEDLKSNDGEYFEKMTVRFETNGAASLPKLREAFYQAAKDLNATHPIEYLEKRLYFEPVGPGTLARVARTGKIRPVIDLRKI